MVGGGAVEHRRKLVHGEGLGEVIAGSAAHGLDGGIHGAGSGHGDHRGLRVEELDLGDQLQPLVAARRQVDQQNVGGAAAQQVARLLQVAGALDRVAQAGGDLRAGRAHGGVGIHHQQVQPRRRLRKLRHRIHGSCVEDCFQHCIRLAPVCAVPVFQLRKAGAVAAVHGPVSRAQGHALRPRRASTSATRLSSSGGASGARGAGPRRGAGAARRGEREPSGRDRPRRLRRREAHANGRQGVRGRASRGARTT